MISSFFDFFDLFDFFFDFFFERHHVGWDASDGRNGGAERTVRESWVEMERCYLCASEKG